METKLKEQEQMLKRLAVEYFVMGKECEHEHMTAAAIKNYEKALQLCPDYQEVKRRLKKLQPKNTSKN